MQQQLKNEFELLNWSNVIENNDIEESSKLLIQKINDTLAHFTKKGVSKEIRESLPWINNEIRKLMRERDSALKKSLKSKNTCDRQIFTSLRNKVINQMRKAKANFFIDSINMANGNGTLVWRNLNKLLGRTKKTNTRELQLQINGTLVDSLDIIVDSFNGFFISSIKELTMRLKCPDIEIKPLDNSKPIFYIKEISVPDI